MRHIPKRRSVHRDSKRHPARWRLLAIPVTAVLFHAVAADTASGQVASPDAVNSGLAGTTGDVVVDMSRPGDHGQRYLEIAVAPISETQIIRVTPLNIPGLTGGAAALYAGKPFAAPDPTKEDLARTFMASQLVCEPVPFEFSALSQIAITEKEAMP